MSQLDSWESIIYYSTIISRLELTVLHRNFYKRVIGFLTSLLRFDHTYLFTVYKSGTKLDFWLLSVERVSNSSTCQSAFNCTEEIVFTSIQCCFRTGQFRLFRNDDQCYEKIYNCLKIAFIILIWLCLISPEKMFDFDSFVTRETLRQLQTL